MLNTLFNSAETPVAFLKFDDCFENFFPAKIWKQRFCNVNFAVSDLPQKKVGNAEFAASSHQKINFGQTRAYKDFLRCRFR